MNDRLKPKVAVIVPLYNGGAFIEQTLLCVLGQTHRTLEVIVVDDGSTDDGLDVVCRHLGDERVTLIRKPHLGIAGTRNAGLAWADPSSEYVLFLDQDDLLDAGVIEGLVDRLAQRPEAMGAHAIADFIDGDGRPAADGAFAALMRVRLRLRGSRMVTVPPESDVVWPEIFPANNLYPPSAVLLRHRDVIELGGFDQSYAVADDWDLMLRLLRRGPILSWNELVVGYRRYGGNASGNRARNVRETRAVWANTYFSTENTRADRALLRRWWRAHQRVSARRKLGQARTFLGRGRVCRAIGRAADAAAHIVLATPLRSWRLRDGGAAVDLGAKIGRRDRGQSGSAPVA